MVKPRRALHPVGEDVWIWFAVARDVLLHPTVLPLVTALLVASATAWSLRAPPTAEGLYLTHSLASRWFGPLLPVGLIGLALLCYPRLGYDRILNRVYIVVLAAAVIVTGLTIEMVQRPRAIPNAIVPLLAPLLAAALLPLAARRAKLIGVWRQPGALARRRYATFFIVSMLPLVAVGAYRAWVRYTLVPSVALASLLDSLPADCEGTPAACARRLEDAAKTAAGADPLYFHLHPDRMHLLDAYVGSVVTWLRALPPPERTLHCTPRTPAGGADDAFATVLATAEVQPAVVRALEPEAGDLDPLRDLLTSAAFDPRSPISAARAELIALATGKRVPVQAARAETLIERFAGEAVVGDGVVHSLRDPLAYEHANTGTPMKFIHASCPTASAAGNGVEWTFCPLATIEYDADGHARVRSIGCIWRAVDHAADPLRLTYYVQLATDADHERLLNALVHSESWHFTAVGGSWQAGSIRLEEVTVLTPTQDESQGKPRKALALHR